MLIFTSYIAKRLLQMGNNIIDLQKNHKLLEAKHIFSFNSENFYKLYNEGWAWTNNYSPRNSCATGNNEMSGMVSLFTINNTFIFLLNNQLLTIKYYDHEN